MRPNPRTVANFHRSVVFRITSKIRVTIIVLKCANAHIAWEIHIVAYFKPSPSVKNRILTNNSSLAYLDSRRITNFNIVIHSYFTGYVHQINVLIEKHSYAVWMYITYPIEKQAIKHIRKFVGNTKHNIPLL